MVTAAILPSSITPQTIPAIAGDIHKSDGPAVVPAGEIEVWLWIPAKLELYNYIGLCTRVI